MTRSTDPELNAALEADAAKHGVKLSPIYADER